MKHWLLIPALAACLFIPVPQRREARAEDLPPKYRAVVDKGLEWLVKQQNRDGHWEANGGQFASAMTAHGRHRAPHGRQHHPRGQVRRQHPPGRRLPHEPRASATASSATRTPPTRASATCTATASASCSCRRSTARRRTPTAARKLEDILTRAVEFLHRPQTSRGGWGYVSAADGNDFDEGSVSVTQVQALRAARNAGIVVPKQAIDKTHEYLKQCTTPRGGADLQPAERRRRRTADHHGGRHRLHVQHRRVQLRPGQAWLKFVQAAGPDRQRRQRPVRPLRVHALLLRPGDLLPRRGRLRQAVPRLAGERPADVEQVPQGVLRVPGAASRTRTAAGPARPIGQVYTDLCYLTILQLDNGVLPIYQR